MGSRGIALLFLDLGARRGWVVSTTPPSGFDPRTVQPVVSHYTDWATRPTEPYVPFIFSLQRNTIQWNSYVTLCCRCSTWPLCLRFPTKTLYIFMFFPHMLHIHQPFHSPWFEHLNSMWWEVQIMTLLIMWFSLVCCYLPPFRPKYRL
jgi:hypothetical protein